MPPEPGAAIFKLKDGFPPLVGLVYWDLELHLYYSVVLSFGDDYEKSTGHRYNRSRWSSSH